MVRNCEQHMIAFAITWFRICEPCLAFAMLPIAASAGKTQLPKNLNIKAVFVFGDSIVDQGNNNNITTLIKCNFPPYGKDFIDGKPTGRFTNAKTPADLIVLTLLILIFTSVEELGIKELMPAYLDPKLQAEDLKTGVSFASGACGYDPQTAAIASVIPLSTQLNHFQEYVGKLKGLVGEEEANTILHSSLYFVVAGSNDLANTYFTIGLRQKQYDINSYTDLMVDGAADFIQELYKLGARKIGVFGIPPVGCLPFQRTVSGGIFRMCVEEYNEAALLANTKLSAAINDSLSKKLPQSKLVFIDLYDPMLDLIINPKKYGFEVVEKGCCGTGNIEVLMLCKYGGTCEDDTKYLFWDSYHPTERGYRILVDQMMKKYINSFT
ncbi:PREDICTED: GDSL esterase/lipase EXL3-like [Nicotiana attenuata]|uniref:GDSL esterase/lipase EXL3-like n=1 Tax=Nicotiana attenuata TaxID=49451 RepID=UPI000904BE72|nr:PREDICTED: GDSL esterase/lipase EXL3-like [Nicotiana attenuata]